MVAEPSTPPPPPRPAEPPPVEPGRADGWWEETPAEAAQADRRYWNEE